MTPVTTHDSAPEDMATCSRCTMTVRTSELWAHTAHAHNVDLDAKASKGKGGKNRGNRGGRDAQ